MPCDGNPNLPATKWKQVVASEVKSIKTKQTDFESFLLETHNKVGWQRGASWSSENSDLSGLVQADAKLWGFCLLSITNSVNLPIYCISTAGDGKHYARNGDVSHRKQTRILLENNWAGLGFFSLKTKLEEPVLSYYVKVQFKWYSFLSQNIKNTEYCE